MQKTFAKTLLQWHYENPRPLPWSNGSRNPYHIWLSEIIMQQTRIEQGTGYYLKFVKKYHTVKDLAEAPLDDVMQLWEGLGYYTRARNLHKAANHIVNNLNGKFPDSYGSLLSLPGIGPYSAAAIASFAYGQRHVVVDGNVKRLISRYSGITESIDNAVTHEKIRTIADAFMSRTPPDIFNQAIMNFGALICTPKPMCLLCPFTKKCFAFNHNLASTLPIRSKKKDLRERFFHFVLIQYNNQILLHKREDTDIWQGLYSLPLIEKESTRSPGHQQLSSLVASVVGHSKFETDRVNNVLYQQKLSHQLINGRFYLYKLSEPPGNNIENGKWVCLDEIHRYGKPGLIVQYLSERFNDHSG